MTTLTVLGVGPLGWVIRSGSRFAARGLAGKLDR
jgi:hypothetical protein